MIEEKRKIKNIKRISVAKIFAFLLVLLLAVSDVYAMMALFRELEYPRQERWVFACTIAIFLEGLPFYSGKLLAEYIDKTKYTVNDKRIAQIGFWVSLAAFLLAISVAVGLRWLYIDQNGAMEAFMAGEYGGFGENQKFIGELFRIFSPVLTSMLAFVASWAAFRSSYLDELYSKVYKLQRELDMAENEFHLARQKNLAARVSLWSTLADPEMEPMPEDFEIFRKQCITKTKEKLNENCISAFPTQIERFSSSVESALEGYILEASKHSTLPLSISRISINEIIHEYEKGTVDPADAWDYNKAGVLLENELERALENTVVVVQFKMAGEKTKKRKGSSK